MSHQHLIDNAVFDTTYSDSAVGFDRRSEFEAFVRNNLMRVVDDVFDTIERDLDTRGGVLRIDRLEIDLGNISCRDYRQQMPGKLRDRLIAAFRQARYSTVDTPLTSPGLVDAKSHARAQLFFFLRHGFLPWYSRLTDTSALEFVLNETIDTVPSRLVTFLNDQSQPSRVIERLTKQFSKSTVQRVLWLLASTGFEDKARNDSVDNGQSQRASASKPGNTALVESVWQALDNEYSQPVPSLAPRSADQVETFDIAAAKLVTGLMSGETALITNAWQALYQEHSDLVRKILRHFGKRKVVRRNIASAFSPVMFDQLLRLLEPGTFDFVKTWLDHAEIFQLDSKQGISARSRTEAALRESTLVYLLVERGQQFSKESYVGVLIQQISASSNFGRSRLLSSLMSNLDRLFKSPGHVDEMSRLINKLANEETSEAAFSTGTVVAGITDLASASENARASGVASQVAPEGRYQRLKSALTRVGAGTEYGESMLLEDIKSLARTDPRLVTDLFHELQNGGAFRVQALESFSAPFLAALSRAFLTSNRDTDHAISLDNRSDLLAAVKRHAEKANDKQAFFVHILGCLINNEAIDFSASCPDRSAEIKPAVPPENRVHAVNNGHYTAGGVHGSAASAAVDASDSLHVPGDEQALQENIYITNAGAVLFAPYLPRLFERLGLVEQDEFVDREAAEFGVHCVQFLVNESVSSPEYQLVLNKLLCGIKPGLPVRRTIELAQVEKEQLEALLHAITQHWKPLANTSISGLRESFLQRNGRLQLKSDAWHLAVEARPFDMLLDQVPWSFSTIKFPWMDRVIYVEWR